VLQDRSGNELKEWNIKTIEKCVKRQIAILITAYKALKVNSGKLVYATCSIDEAENDNVVNTFLNKINRYSGDTMAEVVPISELRKSGQHHEQQETITDKLNDASLDVNEKTSSSTTSATTQPFSIGEATKYGWMFLPDDIDRINHLPSEFGPLYVACIRKYHRPFDSTTHSH